MTQSVQGDWKKFTFKLISKADYPAAVKHLEDYFHQDEPISIISGHSPAKFRDLERWTTSLLEERLSLIVLDKETQEIAGVCVICINRKGQTFDFKCESEEQGAIFEFLESAEEGIDIYEKYGLEEYAEIVMVSVNRGFSGQGLATEMYNRSIQMLKELGYKLTKSAFTSPYTRKIADRFGYEELSRKYFREMKNTKGELLSPNAGEDEFFAIRVLRL